MKVFEVGDFVCIAGFEDPDHWGRVLEVNGDEANVYWGTSGSCWWKIAKLKEYNFGGSQ